MTKYEWIKLKYDVQPNKLICERCGAEALAPMPCRLSDAVPIMDAFADRHKNCTQVGTK